MKKSIMLALLFSISSGMAGTAFSGCEKEFHAMQNALASRSPAYDELEQIWQNCLKTNRANAKKRMSHGASWDKYQYELNRDIQAAWEKYNRRLKLPVPPVPLGPVSEHPIGR